MGVALPLVPAAGAAAQPATGPLVDALVIEHEAVHTFGELGATLDDATKELVRELDAEHRLARDRLDAAVRAAGAEPPAALTAYALPQPVADRGGALAVLLVIEEALARAYAVAAGAPSQPGRALAADLLARTAARQTTLRFAVERSLAGAATAFPGRA